MSRCAVPRQFFLTVILIVIGVVVSSISVEHPAPQIQRQRLINFPMHIGNWHGLQGALGENIIAALKFDDYIFADYHDGSSGEPINFYIAYYATQSAGQSAHSPSSCIPGGGWEIQDIREYQIYRVIGGTRPLTVNRVEIAKGKVKQLVYYWFEQRGRHLTNEYLVKWYLFWDGITQGRTDGALVRLVTPIRQYSDVPEVDKRLSDFARQVYPVLFSRLPN